MGQRREGFVINVGETLDLINTNPLGPENGKTNDLAGKNVSTLAIEVPIPCLVAGHVFFVLGIFFVSRHLRPILLQVTAFTVAHSITLALSITGVFTLPSSIVEPAIALSIAYIAIENVVVKDLRPWRYGMVFGFGLLHGLGFAGVLRELGLPPSAFVPALFGFNVGVELGQLTVIGVAFLMVGSWFRDRTRFVLPASVMIAVAGLYWTLERLNVIA